MKVDLYTKAILTLIALSTTALAADKIHNAIAPAAQAGKSYWACFGQPLSGSHIIVENDGDRFQSVPFELPPGLTVDDIQMSYDAKRDKMWFCGKR